MLNDTWFYTLNQWQNFTVCGIFFNFLFLHWETIEWSPEKQRKFEKADMKLFKITPALLLGKIAMKCGSLIDWKEVAWFLSAKQTLIFRFHKMGLINLVWSTPQNNSRIRQLKPVHQFMRRGHIAGVLGDGAWIVVVISTEIMDLTVHWGIVVWLWNAVLFFHWVAAVSLFLTQLCFQLFYLNFKQQRT